MEELLTRLKVMSNEYKKLSHGLGLEDNEEEYYPDIDIAIDEGKSRAYWKVCLELDKVIEEFTSKS